MALKYSIFASLILVPMLSLAFGDEKPAMTQDQFLVFMANGLVDNKDHCPDIDELSPEQKKSLLGFGQQIKGDEAGLFRNELLAKLRAKNPTLGLKKLGICPDEIASRGPQSCYSLSSKSRKIVEFSVGPYDGAGINCTKISSEINPLKSRPAEKNIPVN